MHGPVADTIQFIDLNFAYIVFLVIVGFIGGLVSGFIGSGGAFVLTPGMMSLGVPGTVAVASNMCHKFPKALVGSIKRYRYGQVDIKLGLIMGVFAEIGVQVGIMVQKHILETWGEAGSNLYVSVSFVTVLVIVGSFVLRDALKLRKSGGDGWVQPPIAARLQKIELWPMMTFKRANLRISVWFIIPVALATGMLAATIAVGGFIGVPGLMYIIGATSIVASATELVVAFVMGLGGTLIWAFYGMVDIRLTLLILGGSLFGVQLGAIGTTYVKDYMIKYVMATIMLIVAVSRFLAMPKYMNKLNLTSFSDASVALMTQMSFYIMCFALLTGAMIILVNMFKARSAESALERAAQAQA
ncbi:sulfite exporter TauE/SafE family protein [Desulfopila sp. IMCC35006]|uniref:sulfite exporter TauE/SafE family protein n=1 Tax=Desulfopila sp. IMCC35006 TaxID=2569542 RepID=UPI0010ABC5F3|nr:sulfite exporter TauE/SafE family protein [Desulfopila sp. IMCC35006]TKB28592.1 sulfite exporter TauE/SafE family protein [Desulfopila sp. IMCC35006]